MRELEPGDIVSRRKGLVMHRGIVLEDGTVLHNTPRYGEHVSTLQSFGAGRRVRVVATDPVRRQQTLRRVRQQAHARRRYRLLSNNCEHTVSRAASGQARSPQLQSWMVGGGLALLAFALTRHPGVSAAAYAVGRRLTRQPVESLYRGR